MMGTIHGERELYAMQDGGLSVSTHRIRFERRSVGSGEFISIMLEELASSASFRGSNPILLAFAVLSVIMGLAAQNSTGVSGVIGVILALIFVAFYFASRRQILVFASAGATIRLQVWGMKLDAAREIIDVVEAAKCERRLEGVLAPGAAVTF